MQLTLENDKYYITCDYGQRDQIRKCGFKWDSERKMWGTKSFYVAMQAVKEFQLEDRQIPEELTTLTGAFTDSYRDTPRGKHPTHLFDYQAAGVEEIARRKNVLLADEQGLGKTLQAIQFVKTFQLALPRTIVICPASLKLNWTREFEQWSDTPSHVIRHGKDKIPKDSNVVIVNYDLLKSKLIMDQLIAFRANILICDEAHYLKNAKTQRTKHVAKLAKLIEKKIFITGTPLLNRPVELYALIKMLSPEALIPYDDYRNYAYRFCNAYNSRWGLDVSGNSNVEELGVRLRATCMVRRLKKDVMKQLPDKTIQLIPFELCKKTEKIIEKEEWFFIEDLRKYPERGSMGELAEIRHELALTKLDESVRYIEDLMESIDKVVIFAHHHDVINALLEKLNKFNPVAITGKHRTHNRQKAVDDFQTKDEVRVFIGQIQAAGTGLTLTAASTVVFVETSWVPGEINQAIDRCHRIGQKDNVTAKFLVVEKSLDETMLKTIFDKEKTINQLLK